MKCKKQESSRVFILFNIALFTEFKMISSQQKYFSSLRAVCQWAPAQFASRNTCLERCEKFKGFIIPGTNQLVCYQDTKEASIVLTDEEPNIKQCGYVFFRNEDRGCNPAITCEYLTDEQCMQKCSKYTVYFTRINHRFIDISYCGEALNIEPITVSLDSKATPYSILRNDNTQKIVFNCSCGIGEEGTEEPMQRRKWRSKPRREEDSSREMVALCPEVLLRHAKTKCGQACENLNGIYSRDDNKFICFHNNEMNVTGSKGTAEYCECSSVIDYRNKLLKISKCPPERRIPLQNEAEGLDCPKKCAKYKGYVFSPNYYQPSTLFCELPSYIFKNLSYEVGETVVVDSVHGNKKYRKYECKCGLRLSQTEINARINTFITNEASNEGSNEVPSISQIRNCSDVRGNEKEINDSQLFVEKNLIQNEDDLIANSNFLYDLLRDVENTTNNNNHSCIPTARKKRPSHQINLDELNRGKKKANQEIDAIVPPKDTEITWMSRHHTATPNNIHIASTNLPQNLDFDGHIIIQDDDDMLQKIIEETCSPLIQDDFFFSDPNLSFDLTDILSPIDFHLPSTSCHHTFPHNNVINNNEEIEILSRNIGLSRSYTSPYMGFGHSQSQSRRVIRSNTLQNTEELGQSASQNIELITSRNNTRLAGNTTSQATGVDNGETMLSFLKFEI